MGLIFGKVFHIIDLFVSGGEWSSHKASKLTMEKIHSGKIIYIFQEAFASVINTSTNAKIGKE